MLAPRRAAHAGCAALGYRRDVADVVPRLVRALRVRIFEPLQGPAEAVALGSRSRSSISDSKARACSQCPPVLHALIAAL